ncbi:hypothetical protein [Paenibacillus sp. S150]|uniref:hypothetical protein n=1 Tax=Paenibacillus sp. S150 TaxID=2749826 RepID=UPI001C57286D|nr:hypothetical protein [Paenibacillus sp. S150]MBW4085029.1 hypothetical protein [Paenibacillus sp. S150]
MALNDWIEGIVLLNYREKNNFFNLEHNYRFDLNKTIMELQDYLTSYETPIHYCNPYEQWMMHASDMAFGLEIYDVIIHFLDKVYEAEDKRPFFVLHEHKKLMQMRINFLQKKLDLDCDILFQEYSAIVKKSNIVSMIYLKYTITKNENIKKNIIHELQIIKDKEEGILNELCNLLIKYNDNADR